MDVEKPDYIEVGRAAHELSSRHGKSAHIYAEKFAAQASSKGNVEEYAFWRLVAKTLEPRTAELSEGEIPKKREAEG
jgi:hypothetical protein